MAVQDRLREVATRQGVRFVRPEKLHLTLLFLDAQPDEALDQFEQICKPICDSTPSFDLTISGIGAFPAMRRPKVLWTGISGDVEKLGNLQRQIQDGLSAFVKQEAGDYSAHITLARINPGSPQVGRDTQPLADELADQPIASFSVQEVVLFESTSDGRYEVVRTWPLHGG